MVASLVANHPLDEAMALAVGGSYDKIGQIELSLLERFGLDGKSRLVDVGCGSGRLSTAIYEKYGSTFSYEGTDVVPELLNYAALQCADSYRFHLVEDFVIPVDDGRADMMCFFSVFTHLLPEESYRYMLQAKRVLKPGGIMVASYLTLSEHWSIFMDSVRQDPQHLNTFLHPEDVARMAVQAGFDFVADIPAWQELGQHGIVARSIEA
jgi:ubiquinone/menaquinone biosynthesis C-methylase UbiE